MTRRPRFIIAAGLLLALACLATTALAADAKVRFDATFAPATARPGEAIVLTLAATIPAGYHLYSMTRVVGGPMRLEVRFDEPRLTPLGPWHAPRPEVTLDPNFAKHVESYSGRVVHRLPLRVAGTAAGPLPVELKIRGQICNEHECIPVRERIAVDLEIEAGAPRAGSTQAPALDGEAFPEDRPAPTAATPAKTAGPPLGEGLIGFLVIAFLAGLGALVTPCVFPMIPITVSYFSKFSKVSMRRAVTMAVVYAGSIVLTFTLVGVLVSAIFGAVGMQVLSASPWFNLFLTLLLVVFAFNLFGLFEIQVPGWLIGRSAQAEQTLSAREGSLPSQAAGVFFMAVTFTLVSFTCTVGFIGVVLAEAAKGAWLWPTLGMLVFAVAFALPFFLLAIFPSWAERLRGKGGDWMVAVKVALGFLELAGALKFLSNVDLVWGWGLVTRPLVLSLWAGLFAATALYLWRLIRLPLSDDTHVVGPLRMFVAALFASLAIYSATGITHDRSLGGWLDGWLPPAPYPGDEARADGGAEAGRLTWIVDDLEAGRKAALAASQPLFIDFTGFTCTNCRFMEASVFPKPEVASRLARMTRVTAYTDGDQPVHETQRALQVERFGTAALPFYAILDPGSDQVLATFASMTNDVAEFTRFLDQGLAAYTPPRPAPASPPATTATTPAAEPLTGAGEALDFELPRLDDGTPQRLSAQRGSWVLLNYWASWCAPCKEELKNVFPRALAAAPGVRLVTVAFDGDETRAEVQAFAREAGLPAATALIAGDDPEKAPLPAAIAGSSKLPLTFLIDPQGRVAWRHDGSLTVESLGAVLARLTR